MAKEAEAAGQFGRVEVVGLFGGGLCGAHVAATERGKGLRFVPTARLNEVAERAERCVAAAAVGRARRRELLAFTAGGAAVLHRCGV